MNPDTSGKIVVPIPNHDNVNHLIDTVLLTGPRSVAITGLAKNSGKTVALNAIIRRAQDLGMQVGVASSGRDGEELDAVTHLPKPRIHVKKGTLVATTEDLAMRASASLEPLSETVFVTVLGRLIIYRAASPGTVEVAGGNKAGVVKDVTNVMRHLGAEFIVVDGAAGRRFSAAPYLADTTVLSTGAVVAETPEKVGLQTARTVEILTTPKWEDGLRESFRPGSLTNEDVVIVSPDASGREMKKLKVRSVLLSTPEIIKQLRGSGSTIILGGALPGNFLRDLVTSRKARNSTIVVKDATRILAAYQDFSHFKSRGGKIRVFDEIHLEMITTCPVAPCGRRFDPATLLDRVAEAVNPYPVVDVIAGKIRNLPRRVRITKGDLTRAVLNHEA